MVVIDLTVSDAIVPFQVVDAFYVLQVHRDAFQTVCNFRGNWPEIDTTGLLEIGKLSYFQTVEPDFPAHAPGAECRRLPVVLDEANIMIFRLDSQSFEALQIHILNVVRRGF